MLSTKDMPNSDLWEQHLQAQESFEDAAQVIRMAASKCVAITSWLSSPDAKWPTTLVVSIQLLETARRQ